MASSVSVIDVRFVRTTSFEYLIIYFSLGFIVLFVCTFVHRFGEGYVAFLRFRQPISSTDLRKAVLKYFPRAVVSSRQASAARLLVPRSQDMLVSSSFNKLKLLAEELKATDYTLTQSSLDQVRIIKVSSVSREI